jgi:hypothetical protein
MGVAGRDTWQVLLGSRALIWVTGIAAVLRFGFEPSANAPADVRPYGWLVSLLTLPATPWDAGHYVAIADRGYDAPLRAAFFPLYPLLARAVTAPLESPLLGGVFVSFAALAAALYLLHKLVTLELGERYARPALLVTALFPTAFFFSAIYTESLFLALSVGAIYAARRQRWALAALAGGLAAATRNTGVLLLVPLVLLPRARPRDLLWLAAVPAGLLAVLGYWATRGDPLEPFHAQRFWYREFSPLGGAAHGAWDAVVSAGQVAAGPGHHLLATPTVAQAGQLASPLTLASVDLVDFGFLAFAVVALVGVARRLPLAYAAYAGVALLAAVSSPNNYEPLMSLPRFVAVIFPLQMWLAAWAVDRDRLTQTLTVSAGLLVLLSAEFATWRWVA